MNQNSQGVRKDSESIPYTGRSNQQLINSDQKDQSSFYKKDQIQQQKSQQQAQQAGLISSSHRSENQQLISNSNNKNNHTELENMQSGGINQLKSQSQNQKEEDLEDITTPKSNDLSQNGRNKVVSNADERFPNVQLDKFKQQQLIYEKYSSGELTKSQRSQITMGDGVLKVAQHNFDKAYQIAKTQRLKDKVKSLVNDLQDRREKRLKKRHYLLINDRAIVIKVKKGYQTCCQRVQNCCSLLDQCIGSLFCIKPFHPYNNLNLLNQCVENLFIIVCLFLYTLFCFFDWFHKEFFFYICSLSLVVFTSGTFLRLNTGFFDQGVINYDRKLIIKKYRTQIMFYDIVAFIGQIYQIYSNDNSQITKILCFLLILKYKVYLYNMDKIEERMNLKGNMVYMWQIVKLMCTVLALCHIVGTAYFFLAFCEQYYLDEKITWVDKIDFWDRPPHEQYLESYYWALATVTLIGTKGDTPIETAFTIFTLTNTIGIFATILSSVANVYQDMEQKQKSYKKDRDTLNSFFEIHPLPNDIQGQLHNYLKYSFQGHQEKSASKDFEVLMHSYPPDLQEVVQHERYNKQIKKFSLLSQSFSEKTVNCLINYIQEEYFMPSQVIQQRGVQQEPKLYLIMSGEAEIYLNGSSGNKNESIIQTLNPGEYFGENTFFNDGIPFYSVKSKEGSFTTCITIKQSDFINIINLKGHEKDREIFFAIQDEVRFNHKNQNKSMQFNCCICGSSGHSEQYCRLTFFNPNKFYLVARINHRIEQKRNDFSKEEFEKRRIKKQSGQLIAICYIQHFSEQICNNPKLQFYVKEIQNDQRRLEMKNQQSDSYSSDEDSEDFTSFERLEKSYHFQGASDREIDIQTPNQIGSPGAAILTTQRLTQNKKLTNFLIQEEDEFKRNSTSAIQASNNSMLYKNTNNYKHQKSNNSNMGNSNNNKQFGFNKQISLKNNANKNLYSYSNNNNNNGNNLNSDVPDINNLRPGSPKTDENYNIREYEEYEQIDTMKLNNFDMLQRVRNQNFQFLDDKQQNDLYYHNNNQQQQYINNNNQYYYQQQQNQQQQYQKSSQNRSSNLMNSSSSQKLRKQNKIGTTKQQQQYQGRVNGHKLTNQGMGAIKHVNTIQFSETAFIKNSAGSSLTKPNLLEQPNAITQARKPSLLNPNILQARNIQRKSIMLQQQNISSFGGNTLHPNFMGQGGQTTARGSFATETPMQNAMYNMVNEVQIQLNEFYSLFIEKQKIVNDDDDSIKGLYEHEFGIELDRMSQFDHYFPQNNFEKVMNLLIKRHDKNQKKLSIFKKPKVQKKKIQKSTIHQSKYGSNVQNSKKASSKAF